MEAEHSLLEDEQTRHSYREHYAGWKTLWNLYQNQTEWRASVKERTRGFFQQPGKWQALFHWKWHEHLIRKLQNLHRLKKSKEEFMMCLRYRGGVEHWSKDSMLATAATFYLELCAEKPIDLESMKLCLRSLTRTFREDKQWQLDEDWMPEELKRTLQSFKNSKTPVLDGLPKEFYLTFWDLMGPDLLELF
ncbi:hypothetical protein Y1Q_0004412 [Alligator mississippiensis]|uniref:Uncharacterized protein n=1 Tax=Alligator mississippiensis TaxID=8496 RepID=A0A151MW69_ALLMI|nr:hypothetical protein Y1Q_0004412 [Alligator mississippiensis]